MKREDLSHLSPAERWERHVTRSRAYAKAYMPGYVRRRYKTDRVYRETMKRRARQYYRANRVKILARLRENYQKKKNV